MRKKKFISLLSLFLSSALPIFAQETPLSLQQKFIQAQAGDFIVTAQEGNYSLLFIRSITADILLLEEISIPEKQIEIKKIDWKKWIEGKALGHTSWTLYEIDRKSGTLIECFSYSKNGWLYLDESEQFLTKLLTLPLYPISEKERKKIGPQPMNGEADQRSSWNPPLMIDGKKIDKPAFEVLKTQCSVELYFSKQQPAFPFPYWLEIQSPHYAFKMRTIDSGHGLISPMSGSMPHRIPQILGMTQKGMQSWKIAVQTPAYFQKLHLFVLDLTGESKATIPIPFIAHKGKKNEELILEIASSDLNKILKFGHRYQWVLIPEGSADVYVESEELFTW
jgi:hypothetical protein